MVAVKSMLQSRSLFFLLSRIQAAKPTQVNKVNIHDSVISRSNLNFEGEENVEDSVIHKNSKD